MITNQADDLILRNLRRLPHMQPDAERAARVRTRCRAAIARPQRRARGVTRAAGVIASTIESALIATVCVTYVVAFIIDVLRLHGLR